ncbi:MAG: SUMF1/EgtB/PvdO family nonheme iron enzyme [Promethearchaeota archaeon]
MKIPAGDFKMGQVDGNEDERPLHKVQITKSFYMATTPVTNVQWELFKPKAAKSRGDWGISEEDDSAAIFLNWYDAVAFCDWLSAKEGRPYRLPTEAEWEYACRAGTTTRYWTGDTLPVEFRRDNPEARENRRVVVDDGLDSTRTGLSTPNPWGLHDMHGVVEEWCLDWYGKYPEHVELSIDPVGRLPGYAGAWKVTRGGAYEALVADLRSASRMAQHPTSKGRFIGFRIVQAPPVISQPLPPPPRPANAVNVNQVPYQWNVMESKSDEPIWKDPIPYINPAPTAINAREHGIFPHNHCPAITWCDNGDLLAVWFSCIGEHDRDSFVILASRLVPGTNEWQEASLFYKCPGRNMTGSSLFNDGAGRLLHFNGNDESTSWSSLIMTMRESFDNGRTWGEPRNIGGAHGYRNQVIACTRKLQDGSLIQLCDASPSANGGSAFWFSADNGKTWKDLGEERPWPKFKEGETGAWIAGIHGGVEEIEGGLLAFGRDNNINGMMPQSISRDGGLTWTYSASPFPAISWGQRLVLMRLSHSPGKPLVIFSFTNPRREEGEEKETDGMNIVDSSGNTRRVFGLFSALSFDDGKTWSHHKLISDESSKTYPCMDYKASFTMDGTRSEPSGYMAACQSPDGIVHLISSSNHYRFNLSWLKKPMGAHS